MLCRTRCILILGLFLTGCSRVPSADGEEVSAMISDRIEGQAEWRQGNPQEDEVQAFIQCASRNELSADSAIQMALLNNPQIQVTFEELGIAQADLIEAGLLSNPVFGIEIRYPHVKGLHTNIEYLLTTSLLDIFLIPLRTKLAAIELEQAKLRVSNAILGLAFDVRETYYELVATSKKIHYARKGVELVNIISEISAKQKAIGNINALEFQLALTKLLEAEVELSQSQVELIRLREKLNRLLGFTEETCLILPENLPEIDYEGFDLCALESIALDERLDLQVARFEVTRLCQMLGLKEWWTYTHLNGGVAGERDPDGTNLIGPGFSGELPIFNYGQAARIRLFAQLRQAQERLAALEIKVLSEVREAHKLLMSYLKIIQDYQERLLPKQNNISDSSEEFYNVMGLGLDRLLENKRLQLLATQKYTESVKQYLVARVELDRALGGYLFKLISKIECTQGVP